MTAISDSLQTLYVHPIETQKIKSVAKKINYFFNCAVTTIGTLNPLLKLIFVSECLSGIELITNRMA